MTTQELSERMTKFQKGIPGKSSDRWTAKPDIEPCWRGDFRDWNLAGESYQEQLYCRFWETFINPSGFSCEACKNYGIFNWRAAHLHEAFAGLVTAQGKTIAGEILVRAVEAAQIGEKEALELADKFEIDLRNRIKHAANSVGRIDLTGCGSCKDKMLARARAMRPKISVIINSHNEGPRLRATVQAMRANLGEWPHEFIVVADEVTDGCADNLVSAAPGVRLVVIRNEKRRGCAHCKRQGVAQANGDVFVFLDAHQNVIAGQLSEMGGRALQDDAIYVPVIRNIDYDEQWNASAVDRQNHVPCVDGMRFETRQYMFRSDKWVREHHQQEIKMVGVGLAISRKTFERIGGFNAYRGEHGSQERGIALRAFMAGVPVKLDGSVILGHEYRYDAKRKKKKRRPRGFRPYSARGQACNYWHAFYVVAGDAAFEKMRPRLRRKALYGGSIVKVPHVIAERARFQAEHKRRTDAELLGFLGLAPYPAQEENVGLLAHADEQALNPEVVDRWRRSCAWGAPLVQHPAEISAAYAEVKKLRPSVFVEVGSESGGSLYVYAGACARGATIIAVDEGSGPRYVARLEQVISALCAEGFNAKWICGNSHDAETLRLVAEQADGPVDFLHIDGDHTKKGVLQDWNDYGGLVRAGCMIAMHDIRVMRLGVPAAWKSIVAEEMRHREFASGMINNHEEMGVGLIWKGVREG